MGKLFVTSSILLGVILNSCSITERNNSVPLLKVSENRHFIVDDNGDPFFWLGDTGWLLFTKLTREEAMQYLDDRGQKGFNVIQVMVLHDIKTAVNVYGDSALIGRNVAMPRVTPGDSYSEEEEYDYWDHVDYIVRLAEEREMYMALVPIWGSNVKTGLVTAERMRAYGEWISNRYKDRSNIIWLNGGDIQGTTETDVWAALGNALEQNVPDHLKTFHPFGRTQSSTWFHDEEWLDFNMIQSGHRRYDQDDADLSYGEDNWRYIQSDYNRVPTKPVLDGEPSYEGIPQGLHDTTQPYWTDADARRYAYWSVFAGAFGHTYGHSAVMQFYKPGDTPAYGAKLYWYEALDAPGAGQMKYLKELICSRSFLDRVPDQSILQENRGERYAHLLATRGEDYAFVYSFTGRNFNVTMGKIDGDQISATWFDPRNGNMTAIGVFNNDGVVEFDPPGEPANGNDWVLVLDSRK